VLALQITSAGVIASLAISRPADIALLLVIPLSSYMLGSRYILHDYHLRLISRYIRDSLSGRLQGNLAWERWKADQIEPDVQRSNWFTATGWNLVHPTRLAFEGIAWLALLAAAFAAAYVWRDKVPAWGLILGFVLLWILGAIAAAAGACCPEPERTAALPDSVSRNGVVAPEDGLRSGEHLSELPGQAAMLPCCPPSRPTGPGRHGEQPRAAWLTYPAWTASQAHRWSCSACSDEDARPARRRVPRPSRPA